MLVAVCAAFGAQPLAILLAKRGGKTLFSQNHSSPKNTQTAAKLAVQRTMRSDAIAEVVFRDAPIPFADDVNEWPILSASLFSESG